MFGSPELPLETMQVMACDDASRNCTRRIEPKARKKRPKVLRRFCFRNAGIWGFGQRGWQLSLQLAAEATVLGFSQVPFQGGIQDVVNFLVEYGVQEQLASNQKLEKKNGGEFSLARNDTWPAGQFVPLRNSQWFGKHRPTRRPWPETRIPHGGRPLHPEGPAGRRRNAPMGRR